VVGYRPETRPPHSKDIAMTISARTRITAAFAGALVSAGLLAGVGTLTTTDTQYLADYGSSITAEDASNAARDKGVPHMSDRSHSPGYFERMNGGDR
jgi:hypothetical protein